MSSKYTIAEGVRMVGHLLEHHPATGCLARRKNGGVVGIHNSNASCWCLFGAAHVVEYRLNLGSFELVDTVADVTGIDHGRDWDSHEDKLSICKKLQEYKG